MLQTIVPAIRVATQILGVVAGKQAGMLIIQCTQVITILGGPAGYMYVFQFIMELSILTSLLALSSTSLPVRPWNRPGALLFSGSFRAPLCSVKESAI